MRRMGDQMDRYGAETYGEAIAEVYDDWYPTANDDCIELLASLGKSVRVLELGIGTGRVAIPLKSRGVDIQGIDASPAMAERLKRKEPGSSIPVTMGDFSLMSVDGTFGLIFIVFNTFFALTTQESQTRCMKSVARHLDRDGRFVMEAFVPDTARFVDGQAVRVTKLETDRVQLDVSIHDRVLQQVSSQHVVISRAGVELYPVLIRYAWPSELDAMADAAGMKLIARWEDWRKSPFSTKSGGHVSVYGMK